jgi:hypothetical protein
LTRRAPTLGRGICLPPYAPIPRDRDRSALAPHSLPALSGSLFSVRHRPDAPPAVSHAFQEDIRRRFATHTRGFLSLRSPFFVAWQPRRRGDKLCMSGERVSQTACFAVAYPLEPFVDPIAWRIEEPDSLPEGNVSFPECFLHTLSATGRHRPRHMCMCDLHKQIPSSLHARGAPGTNPPVEESVRMAHLRGKAK